MKRTSKRGYWTHAEVRVLARLYPDTPTERIARRLGRTVNCVQNKAKALGLKKSTRYMRAMLGRLSRRLLQTGAAYRFVKGFTPWNKGMKGWTPGGRSLQTRFQPGHASNWDPEIYCIGALRVSTKGDLHIKIGLGLRSWRNMRRYVWETEVGPIPPRTHVAARNGDPHDTRIENLELVSFAEMMRRNTMNRYPREIVRAYQMIGALRRQINRKERHEQEPHRPA